MATLTATPSKVLVPSSLVATRRASTAQVAPRPNFWLTLLRALACTIA